MRQALNLEGHSVSIVSRGMLYHSDGSTSAIQKRPSLPERIKSAARRTLGRRDVYFASLGDTIANAFAMADQNQKLDVIEMEESFGWAGTVQKALSIPVVTRLHGPHFLGQCDTETGEAAALSDLREAAEGRAIQDARFLSAPSDTLLKATIARYKSSALHARFIPNPIPVRPDRSSWTLATCDRDMVLCVGRFDRRKGADIAVKAFVDVLRHRPSARLVMVGPQPGVQIDGDKLDFNEFCERFVPTEARERIVHLGLLKPDEIEQLRLQAFATIVCSRFENFPYAIAEAMTIGCPVIATRSFGNAEMITDGVTGKLVDVEAIDQLAQVICWAYDHPTAMANLGAAGQKHCHERYNPDVILAETLDLYSKALA